MSKERIDYWSYYEDDFDWGTNSQMPAPDPDHTIKVLKSGGVSSSDAELLMESGYVCFPGFDIVIDRFMVGRSTLTI